MYRITAQQLNVPVRSLDLDFRTMHKLKTFFVKITAMGTELRQPHRSPLGTTKKHFASTY